MVTALGARRLTQRLLGGLRRDAAGFLAAVRALPGVRPGLYTYRVHPPGGSRRIHLRIEADGSGVLLVDVSDVVHLNQTATLVAKSVLDKRPLGQTVGMMRNRFRGADPARLEREVQEIYAAIGHLAETTDKCPTCGLARLGRTPLFSVPVRAPYKADLALTYGCNNACRHCYNEPERKQMPPLGTDGWRRVLRKLASVGVPQVIFTGGEPTLCPGLPELIAEADRLGLVCGLNTNGRRLARSSFTRALARAGLSHVQITLESCRADVHNAMTGAASFDETVRGIRGALQAGLHTITNTTLTRRNIDHVEQIVEFLARLGLGTFAANGMIYSGQGRTTGDALGEAELGPVVVRLRDRAAELGLRFLWYTPTAYCRLSPVVLELGPRRCNAAEYSVCIEPNGDVLPCQSYYRPAGNILRDRWETIWNSPLFRSFRDRVADPRGSGLPSECWGCPDLSLCGGGCRLDREHDPLSRWETAEIGKLES